MTTRITMLEETLERAAEWTRELRRLEQERQHPAMWMQAADQVSRATHEAQDYAWRIRAAAEARMLEAT